MRFASMVVCSRVIRPLMSVAAAFFPLPLNRGSGPRLVHFSSPESRSRQATWFCRRTSPVQITSISVAFVKLRVAEKTLRKIRPGEVGTHERRTNQLASFRALTRMSFALEKSAECAFAPSRFASLRSAAANEPLWTSLQFNRGFGELAAIQIDAFGIHLRGSRRSVPRRSNRHGRASPLRVPWRSTCSTFSLVLAATQHRDPVGCGSLLRSMFLGLLGHSWLSVWLRRSRRVESHGVEVFRNRFGWPPVDFAGFHTPCTSRACR